MAITIWRGRSSPSRQWYRCSATIQCHRGFHAGFVQASTGSNKKTDIENLLKEPSWSLESLLPPKDASASGGVTSKQLHHLLRLSALPPPKDNEEEARMLATLADQLHFVREIQNVDTSGVPPLQSLRDETDAGKAEMTIGMDELKDALAGEEVKGQYYNRLRRRRDEQPTKSEVEDWDVLGQARRKAGRYFVVEGGKQS